MSEKRVLFVDDNKEICEMVSIYMNTNDIEGVVENNPLKVLDILKETEFNIIVLDISMPGKDGFELFKDIKKEYNVPILFLSAKSHDLDRIQGLKLGAEDYMVKPFNLDELFLKVDIILSRLKSHIMYIDGFKFDLVKQEVYLENRELKLTKKSYQLLFLLLNNKGKVLTRQKLLKEVWGYDEFLDDRTIDTHIKEVRKQLNNNNIKTIRNKGYMYEDL